MSIKAMLREIAQATGIPFNTIQTRYLSGLRGEDLKHPRGRRPKRQPVAVATRPAPNPVGFREWWQR
jgi:hypothetical protein